jgi:hypothetical protein
MSRMPKGPIRRSQLIAPFGVASLSVTRDGTSVITAGLDHWYQREDGTGSTLSINTDEFVFEEWRLQALLNVDHFREPPDYRFRRSFDESPNLGLTVPFLRFPQWHFCPNCSRLKELPLSHRDKEYCSFCLVEKKWRIGLVQVPFVATCAAVTCKIFLGESGFTIPQILLAIRHFGFTQPVAHPSLHKPLSVIAA